MIEELRQCLDKDTRGDMVFFIKKQGVIPAGIVLNAAVYDPVKEFESYQTLSPYLRMPKYRLLNHRERPLLVIRGVDDVPVSSLLESNPKKALEASTEFWKDTFNMWEHTVVDVDETKFSRHMRIEKAASLDKLEANEFIGKIIDKPVIVNGVEYPALRQTMNECKNTLRTQIESVMVLKHGDEQVDNILVSGGKYYAIDPAWRGVVGYGPPSFPVNLFIGTNYNFYYHWTEEHALGDKLEINLSLQDRSVTVERAFRPLFAQLLTQLDELSPIHQFKENIFENFLRIVAGYAYRPSMNIEELFTRPMAFVALANQAYYGDLIKEVDQQHV